MSRFLGFETIVPASATFTTDCKQCKRLAGFLASSKKLYPDYHSKPVAPFGDVKAQMLIVGLAPGLHGANATGRPFTGDHAGILLYDTLYRYGLASLPESKSADDDLRLNNCRITNAVKCVPPENKPIGDEINRCNGYLQQELADPRIKLVVALGGIAHSSVLKAKQLKKSLYKFGHAAEHQLEDGLLLLDSYHCSRYNTSTKRLTEAMFHQVFKRAAELLEQ